MREPYLLCGHADEVAEWVAARIPHAGGGFGRCEAIGVFSPDCSKMWAGVVYHAYSQESETIQISIAADVPLWATRGTIRALLHVPFYQMGVFKAWCVIPHTNEKSLKVNRHIGFKSEATLAHHFGRGTHAIITRMFRPDYDRIYRNG